MRRGTRKTHAKDLDRCRHGVGRIHPTTATRARAGVAFQLLHFFSRHITMVPFPDTFENRNQVDIFSIEIPWSNGPTISKDRWNIHIGNGNHRTRHVLITTTDGYKGIHVVTPHSRFDRIRNDITWRQGEAHPWSPHSNPVRNRNGAKLDRPSSCILHTFFGQFSKIVEVDVTRGIFRPCRNHSDNRFLKAFIGHSRRAKHGTVGRFYHAIVDTTTMAFV